jgi:hypothetical protein
MDLQQSEDGNSDENVLDPNEPYPVVIAPFYFALLSVATFGLYVVWWQFKCWRYFKQKEQSDIMPALRALFFLFFGIELFNKIATCCRQYDHQVSYNTVVLWLACLLINFAGYLPSPFFLLGILTFAPVLLAVQEFNFYFTANKNGYRDDKLTDRQILLLVMGALFWALMIYGLLFDKTSLPK